jgi:hypothetical protein
LIFLLIFVVFFNQPGKKYIAVGEWNDWNVDEGKKAYDDNNVEVIIFM